MHPRTQEMLAFLDTQRAALERAVQEVPASLHARRPAPGAWSVAEVIEHLGLVEGRLAQLIAARLEAARAEGVGSERDERPVLPTIDVTRMLDRSRKIAASEQSQPQGRLDVDAAWTALGDTRRRLREAIVAADGMALGDVAMPHPAFGPMNVYQWIGFVGAHEARHTAQIREIAGTLQA